MSPWFSTRPAGSKARLGAVQALSVVAAVVSAYLLYHAWTGSALPGCGLESGCGAVTRSRWAYILKWPVSLPALALYLSLLAATVLLKREARSLYRAWIEGFLVFAATALVLAAIWFTGLQLFVIKAICPYCMAAHACGFLAGVLLLGRFLSLKPNAGTQDEAAGPVLLLPWQATSWIAAGIMAVTALAAGQYFYRAKSYEVQTIASGIGSALVVAEPAGNLTGRNSSSSPSQELGSTPQQQSRTITLHGGQFRLNLGEVPLVGSTESPYVIVHLFDYSCEHCRHLHPLLVEAVRTLSNQLAIVSLPVPLATNCNPLLKRVIPAHTNACEYARAGLAVWRANPARLAEFDDWIFTPPRPPSPEEVRAQARTLVGSNAFEKAWQDPWIERQLKTDIQIFGTNYLRFRKSQLPQLMIGSNVVTGVISKPADLYRLLTNQFDLRVPNGPSVHGVTSTN